MASGRPQDDRNQEATVYMGNLDERCTDALIWELMLQAGPVVNVHLPKDRISMSHQGYGFCEFLTEDDAEYACKIMNQIKLYGKPIRVNKASSDRKQLDIGANLFVGNLDPNVDERMLFDTFMSFGTLVQPAKISRDAGTGASKGFGFISFDSFEASDAAIESMNGQFLMNKPVTVGYAFKKEGKGERHGTPAERLLAAQARKNNALPPAGAGFGGPPPPPGGGMYRAPMMGGQGMGMPGMGGMVGANPGMGGAPPPPPPGFATGANGYGVQQQGYGGQQGAYGMPPPPPPGFGGQQGAYGMPPPPPPGFS
ncbi:hypothetical protein MNV49_003295 [Pseudohyphozyma bogoriensis]|nr:hypothetical protein MNV49_003295 [Pseudohyphozyma bogoriensis]